MQHLGSLHGAGLLLIGEERHDVTYRIDVWRDRKGEKTGSGALTASPKILDAAFHAKRVALHLATGETVESGYSPCFPATWPAWSPSASPSARCRGSRPLANDPRHATVLALAADP
jgi:hypothetical protein